MPMEDNISCVSTENVNFFIYDLLRWRHGRKSESGYSSKEHLIQKQWNYRYLFTGEVFVYDQIKNELRFSDARVCSV